MKTIFLLGDEVRQIRDPTADRSQLQGFSGRRLPRLKPHALAVLEQDLSIDRIGFGPSQIGAGEVAQTARIDHHQLYLGLLSQSQGDIQAIKACGFQSNPRWAAGQMSAQLLMTLPGIAKGQPLAASLRQLEMDDQGLGTDVDADELHGGNLLSLH
jgi:hypothetical protein